MSWPGFEHTTFQSTTPPCQLKDHASKPLDYPRLQKRRFKSSDNTAEEILSEVRTKANKYITSLKDKRPQYGNPQHENMLTPD